MARCIGHTHQEVYPVLWAGFPEDQQIRPIRTLGVGPRCSDGYKGSGSLFAVTFLCTCRRDVSNVARGVPLNRHVEGT